MEEKISIKKARVNNLKEVSLEIPKKRLVVITGLSGSGKSSLAFDTIYAEGQRRYAESLSSYAKQFLDLMDKPDVENIEGLSPTIAISQQSRIVNPRSTVGTVTEVYDYLRLLYARVGTVHCPECGREVNKQTPEGIVKEIISQAAGLPVQILAPITKNKKGSLERQLNRIARANYELVRIDGRFSGIDEAKEFSFGKDSSHTIEILVDSFVVPGPAGRQSETEGHRRLKRAVDFALDLGNDFVTVYLPDKQEDKFFNLHYFCHYCGLSLQEIEPRSFSFNSPFGACSACRGLGVKLVPDPELIIPNKRLTLAEGAIKPWSRNFASQSGNFRLLKEIAKRHNFSLDIPVGRLPEKILNLLYQGTGEEIYFINGQKKRFPGLLKFIEEKYQATKSEYLQKTLKDYMRTSVCPVCRGDRLKSESLAVKIKGQSIAELTRLDIDQNEKFFQELAKEWPAGSSKGKISKQIIREILKKLELLQNVGLNYLTLSRGANSLAGGEAQRVQLATQISSGLEAVIYILDEPSIGLHARDNDKLIKTLKTLRDKGNSVLVVEHDEQMIRSADYLIDLGPGAGALGGEVVAQGTVKKLATQKRSITGQYLSGRKKIPLPKKLHSGNGKFLEIIGAREFNLKNIDLKIPLAKFVCITGVSGSGKSTLMTKILAKTLNRHFYRAKELPGKHDKLVGLDNLDKVISINQSPIGRTPRSNPATYTGVFSEIRELYANQPESKMRGFNQGHFSFNVKGGGRCETCGGEGMVKIEMQFLPDVYVECEDCHGRRYNQQTLSVHYRQKNIAEVLEFSVGQAREFFKDQPRIVEKLKLLEEVGLGYLKLGQSATTLSGGEAQRIKLASELSRRATGKTLYILDEPTTGLHFDDIKKLLGVLDRLAAKRNSVLVIEHNLDIIKSADWVIDLGPEGGRAGGEIVAQGTPREVSQIAESYTGRYLKKLLAE